MSNTVKPHSFYSGAVPGATPLVFAQVLVGLRASVGCTSWKEFVFILQRDFNVTSSVPWNSLGNMAPSYGLVRGPSVDVVQALEDLGIFKFPNGLPITAGALLETFYGLRDANGDLIP